MTLYLQKKKQIMLTCVDSLLQFATLLQNGLCGKFQIVINFSTHFVIIITVCNFITKRVVTFVTELSYSPGCRRHSLD